MYCTTLACDLKGNIVLLISPLLHDNDSLQSRWNTFARLFNQIFET